jgi:lipopolysaccharide/colanic/teichoic acid biosynthesis glycosyltransferase
MATFWRRGVADAVGGDDLIDRGMSYGVRTPPGRYAAVGKRVLDLTVVLAVTLVVLPFYALIALLVVLLDGRPVHYRGLRVGANGREFHIIKFRTMRNGSEDALEHFEAVNPQLGEEFRQSVKLRFDPRVTRLGRFLRRSSLDELPQLFNVLTGEMSLVGPRPVTRGEWDQFYGERASYVFRTRPGLTGLWQVSGRSLLSYEDRIALDLHYTRSCSLRTDLGILVRTMPSVLRGHGAF